MSETPNIPPLPDAQTYLLGKDGVKALQHDAATLRSFADGFETVPLKPQAAERIVQLGEVMRHPEWPQAHDAAHQALLAARKMVTENPTAELAAEVHNVQSIFNAQAVNPSTLKMVRHPELQSVFAPVKTYLERFGNFVAGWVGLAPARIRPGEESLTPAAHRALGGSHDCGDPSCTIDHTPKSSNAASASKSTPHVYGPGCGHDHGPIPSSGGCGHSHGEPHVPKGIKNGGLWAMGAVGAVCVGAYLINEYGKRKEEKKPESWADRAAPSTQQEARSL